MDIKATVTEQGARLLLDHAQSSVRKYVLLGSEGFEDSTLEGILTNPNVTYADISGYIIYEEEAIAS